MNSAHVIFPWKMQLRLKLAVLSPLVGERQREGERLQKPALNFSPSPQPSPIEGEGVTSILYS
jgi:hypothetical protein